MTRALALVLLAAGVAAAADKAKVDEAVRRGAEYLAKTGGRGGGQGGDYGTGPLALAGLAMLEAGRPPADPVLVDIAQNVRQASLKEVKTYQIALGILFLDRYGNPGDVPLIQVLGCRLLAGQNANGGWTYTSFDAISDADAARLNALLSSAPGRQRKPGADKGFGVDPDEGGKPAARPKLHPEADRIYQAVRKGQRSQGVGTSDDNSNTQFGLMGVWVASRRGVPAADAVRLIEARFLRSQSPADHGWGYNGTAGNSSPSMTCAGLLGLAVGKATAEAKKAPTPDEQKRNADPFYTPPKDDDEKVKPRADVAGKTPRDQAIRNALAALGRLIGGKGVPLGAGGGGFGGVGDLYFFWSLERVAVAYGLDTVGGVDWHAWGCDQLLPAQAADGSWSGSYGPTVATSFAVLFLVKANLTADLTRQITGKVKDPGEGVMTGRKGGPLGISPRGRSEEEVKAGPANAAPVGPALDPVEGRAAVDDAASRLVAADDKAWPVMLAKTRDTKGGKYTLALVLAIPQLEGARLVQARQALADRLFRMTPETLRKMMADRDPELRRAAALAAAMRDDRTQVPDLIERLTDLDDGVVRAARAGLRSLTGKDFGPPSGGSDEQKQKAADDWRYWWASEGRLSK
jgi:hypothetical protein